METKNRSATFWFLALFFAAYVLFLYGPMLVIVVLSFQGPEGVLTFPMRGLSLHWFHKLAEGLGVVDIGAALYRSLGLGLTVMAFTIVFSVLAGLAFRKKLRGGLETRIAAADYRDILSGKDGAVAGSAVGNALVLKLKRAFSFKLFARAAGRYQHCFSVVRAFRRFD